MKKNYLFTIIVFLLVGTLTYAQPPKFSLNFEGANPLSNLPAGVTNVNGTNTVRVKNTTDYPAIPNTVQSDGAGGNELFLDFQGYLRMNITPSTGFSLAYDYRRNNLNDDWWLGFLTFIGNDGSNNVLERIQIRQWDGQLDFGNVQSSDSPIGFDTNYKIVLTCSTSGDINVYVDNVLKLSVPNSTSGKNIHTWTNAGLLLKFKGESFDGTNVTPEAEYALNARDTRAFVDNVDLYERELTASEVAVIYNDVPSYGQAPKFFLDFENASPLSNLPAGVTNVNSTNTIKIKNDNAKIYAPIPNVVQSDGAGGNELFLDFQGYLRMDVPTPSSGFSLAYDYRRNWVNDDWWLGFLTFIGNDGSNNKLEQLQIRDWSGQLHFNGTDSGNPYPIYFDVDYKIVVTCSATGTLKVYVDNVLKLTKSGTNINTWTNAGLLLKFKGSSFDGTNVTPEGSYATDARDNRAFVDNIALYEGEISAAEVALLFANGNNTLSVKDQNVSLKSRVSVYPNPVNDILNFSAPEVKSIAVYNILGAKVLTKAITNSSTDVSSLKTGVYIVNCFDNEGKKIDSVKLIKL